MFFLVLCVKKGKRIFETRFAFPEGNTSASKATIKTKSILLLKIKIRTVNAIQCIQRETDRGEGKKEEERGMLRLTPSTYRD